MKDWSLEAELSGDRSYNLMLASVEDGQRSRITDIFINPETKTFELTFRYDKGKGHTILAIWLVVYLVDFYRVLCDTKGIFITV